MNKFKEELLVLASEWEEDANYDDRNLGEGQGYTQRLCAAKLRKLAIAMPEDKMHSVKEIHKKLDMKDPSGFSADGVLDEAINWTLRSTGQKMLRNYAELLASSSVKAATANAMNLPWRAAKGWLRTASGSKVIEVSDYKSDGTISQEEADFIADAVNAYGT